VNVILISIDSLRADHLGAYGYPRDTTPNLDRLAREGALFETVIAESSWTVPSHATLFTGFGSQVHGMQYEYARLSPARRTIAQILGEHGYRTAGVFSGPYLHPVFGFGRGFASYENVITDAGAAAAEAGAPGDREGIDRLLEQNAISHRRTTSARVTERAIDFLASVGSERFFLFLYYFDPHYDYAPPERFWRMFDPDYAGHFTGEDFIHNGEISPGMDPRKLQHLIARYDGEIRFTDEHIGRLVEALNRNGLRQKTLILVTGDHGEEFFEHENRGHRRTLFGEVLRVPLIASLPERIPSGSRITRLVRHLDIPATILSYAGVRESLPGVDLTGILEGGLPPRGPQLAISRLIRTPGENEWVSLRDESTKYLARRQGTQLTEWMFDLEADPGERAPIVHRTTRSAGGNAPSRLEEARRQLLELERSAPPSDDTRLESTDGVVAPELREELRALGYVE